jgi:hypothetical protein
MKKIIVFAATIVAFNICAADGQAVTEVIDSENTGKPFDGINIGSGFTVNMLSLEADDLTKSTFPDLKLRKLNLNQTSWTMAIGYGSTIVGSPIYLGIEGTVNFQKAKKKQVASDCNNAYHKQIAEKYSAKGKSFVPGFGIRLGVVCPSELLLYTKISLQFSELSIYDDNNKKLGSIPALPYLGIGVEKAICNRFSTRLEFDIMPISRKIEKTFTINNEKHKVAAKCKNYSFRCMVCYNF